MGRKSRRRRDTHVARADRDVKPDLSEISRVRTARRLHADIATWMADPSQGPGSSFLEGEPPADPVAVWAILMGWLVGAREQITVEQAREAVRWVSDSLGVQHDDLVQAAGFIGHPDAPDVTLNEAIERYGSNPVTFTLYMVMLCGGLVATVGDGDPDWLKQFDSSV